MTPRPWHIPGWPRDRVAELAWQLISWPYLVAVGLTVLFVVTVLTPSLHSQTAISSTTAIAGWGLAFAVRQVSKVTDAKVTSMLNGMETPPPSPKQGEGV